MHKKRQIDYHIASVPQKLGQSVWLELFILSRSTFVSWRQRVGRSRNNLRFDHSIASRSSNNYKPTVRETVCECVEMIAALDGHVLSVFARRIDGQYVNPYLDTDNIILLPT